ncbi:TPA: hypothetical protein PC505_003936 [Morganella morganii]|nr:hypothetical protein [Morganella morganii]HDF2424481.1 hypothetical protein [Morganella morganii]
MTIKIESAQESIVRLCDGRVITMEFAMENIFRFPMNKNYIPALRGSNPAFEFWVDKLKAGEKFPRGKYFRACEFLRENFPISPRCTHYTIEANIIELDKVNPDFSED